MLNGCGRRRNGGNGCRGHRFTICKCVFTFTSGVKCVSFYQLPEEPMTDKTLAPQQARSRESTRRLLKAAAEVLGQHGLEAATIPRIAEHAGLTPGAVYRRFP